MTKARVLFLCTHNSARSQMAEGFPTSFANPAVTLARSASDTFAGIRPADVPGFVIAELLGAAAATAVFRWLVPIDVRPRPG